MVNDNPAQKSTKNKKLKMWSALSSSDRTLLESAYKMGMTEDTIRTAVEEMGGDPSNAMENILLGEHGELNRLVRRELESSAFRLGRGTQLLEQLIDARLRTSILKQEQDQFKMQWPMEYLRNCRENNIEWQNIKWDALTTMPTVEDVASVKEILSQREGGEEEVKKIASQTTGVGAELFGDEEILALVQQGKMKEAELLAKDKMVRSGKYLTNKTADAIKEEQERRLDENEGKVAGNTMGR